MTAEFFEFRSHYVLSSDTAEDFELPSRLSVDSLHGLVSISTRLRAYIFLHSYPAINLADPERFMVPRSYKAVAEC